MKIVDLVSDCGYFDQAHMINDYKTLLGKTPKQYFAKCEPVFGLFSLISAFNSWLMRFKFHKKYLICSILLFLVELYIGVFVDDSFIRPYIGDFLVVILLYCILKSFIKVKVDIACLLILIFSYLVEFLQYLKIVELLHLQNIEIARIIIGTSFAWEDIMAYTAGIAVVYIIEKLNNKIAISHS